MRFIQFFLGISLAFNSTISQAQVLCELNRGGAGVLPPTPTDPAPHSIDKITFHRILDEISNIYQPIFKQRGMKFKIVSEWDSNQFNAFASRGEPESVRYVTMYGGLASSPFMTEDGLRMVACHEIGHHLGGAPTYSESMNWASAEGEADYWGTLKCMRIVLSYQDNVAWVRRHPIDSFAQMACFRNFQTPNDQAICMRSVVAGLALARGLDFSTRPNYTKPSREKVAVTMEGHPDPQCRLDTYVAASLCPISPAYELNQYPQYKAFCDPRHVRQSNGVRPSCWYSKDPNPFNATRN